MIVVYSPKLRQLGATYTDDCLVHGQLYKVTAVFLRHATKEEYLKSIIDNGGLVGLDEMSEPRHPNGNFYVIEVLD